MRKWRRGFIGVLVVAAAVAVASPLSSAVAFFSNGLDLEVTVVPHATLVAKGAAVRAHLIVNCNATRHPFVEAEVIQRTSKSIARGFGDARVTCTGSPERVSVLVYARNKPFKNGTAIVNGYIDGCGFGTCGFETDNKTVKISHK